MRFQPVMDDAWNSILVRDTETNMTFLIMGGCAGDADPEDYDAVDMHYLIEMLNDGETLAQKRAVCDQFDAGCS